MQAVPQTLRSTAMYDAGELTLLERLTLTRGLVVLLMLYLSTHGYIPVLMSTDPSQGGADEGVGVFAQAAFLLLVGILCLPGCRRLVSSARYAKALLTIGALAIASCLWSQDPSMTLRRSVMLSVPMVFALFLHVRYSYREQVELFLLTGVAAASLSIALTVLYPSYGLDPSFHDGSWQGIFPQRNVCARACVFFVLPAVSMLGRSGKRMLAAVVALPLLAFLLLMTHSATGPVLAGGMIVTVLGFRLVRRLSPNDVIVLAIALIVAAAACIVVIVYQYQSLLVFLGRDATLTGRTTIWDGAIEAVTKHPVLGYGYSSFWLGLKGESANVVLAARWLIPSAHNGFLDVWLQLGGVGLALFLFTLYQGCSAAVWCLRHVGREASEWAAGIMILTIAYNLDETSIMISRELLWVMYSLAFLNLRKLVREHQSPSRVVKDVRRFNMVWSGPPHYASTMRSRIKW